MNDNLFEIYPNIYINIQKWICYICTFENTTHPYYCVICGNNSNKYNIINSGEYRKKIDKKAKVFNIFNTEKILLPVLSCKDDVQFINNIEKIYPYIEDKKIHGIWITSANCDISIIEKVIKWKNDLKKNIWLGINLIGENIFKVLEFIKINNPDGIWIDNSYFNNETNFNIPEIILDQFEKMNWNGLYFGGVMFKYQSIDYLKKEILNKTHEYIDVLTTSGIATGTPIDIDKLNYIYDSTNEKIHIAIASGISSENILNIKEKCNIFLFRSSIVDIDNNILIDKINLLCEKFYE